MSAPFQNHLYMICYPNQALVLSQLSPEDFCFRYSYGSASFYSGKLIFAELDLNYRNDFFPIDEALGLSAEGQEADAAAAATDGSAAGSAASATDGAVAALAAMTATAGTGLAELGAVSEGPIARSGRPSLTELLEAFLARAALYSEMDKDADASEETNFVHLMTIHAAKGLEFPYVFLPALELGIFPGMQTALDPQGMEEERRLAYVAITRAQKKLYILTSEQRILYGKTGGNPPSPFLEEIPEDYLQRFGGQGRRSFRPEGAWGQKSSSWAGGSSPRLGQAGGSGGSRAFGAGGPRGGQLPRTGVGRPGMATSGAGVTSPDPLGMAFLRGGLSQAGQASRARGTGQAGQVGQAGPGRGTLGARGAGLAGASSAQASAAGVAKTYLRVEELVEGMRVANEKWGTGQLKQFTPVGGDAIVLVAFDQGKERRLMLSMAKLWKA